MEAFTTGQFESTQQLSIEVMSTMELDGRREKPTSVAAFWTLTPSLFCVLQGINTPSYTEQEGNDTGIMLLQQQMLRVDFPYTALQIIDYIVERKHWDSLLLSA
ncbi:MAG: hypothetical protein ABI413_01145 [Ktedonobacteraceae bacterium]